MKRVSLFAVVVGLGFGAAIAGCGGDDDSSAGAVDRVTAVDEASTAAGKRLAMRSTRLLGGDQRCQQLAQPRDRFRKGECGFREERSRQRLAEMI